jgi:hypothetical protein
MMTQLQKLLSYVGLFSTTPLSNRNLFVDGRMDVQGTPNGTAISNVYGAAVMWVNLLGSGGAAGTTQLTDIRSNNNFDSSPRNALYTIITTASTGTLAARTLPAIISKIEGVQTASGKSVTLSFKLWSSIPMTIPGIWVAQNFGTGGSPSPIVNSDKAVNWNLTTVVQRFSVRLDIPALPNGFVLGTNGNDYLVIGLYFPPGVVGTLGMCEAQCELCSPQASSDINGNGGAPTMYEFRGLQAELARVQRYYETVGLTAGSSASNGYTNTATYKVQKRASPAITQINANPLNGATFGAGIDGTACLRQLAVATALSDIIFAADARL